MLSVGMLSAAWVFFANVNGVSPLHSGQWPRFLAFSAALWAAQQVSRPARLAAGLALAPLGDALLSWVSQKLQRSTQAALGVVLAVQAVLLLAVLGCTALFTEGCLGFVAPAAAETAVLP